MDIVERLRVKWTAMEGMANHERAEAADEIERLRERCFSYPALMDNLPHDTLMALHDHIHTIIDERAGANISQSRKAKAKKARAALKEKE